MKIKTPKGFIKRVNTNNGQFEIEHTSSEIEATDFSTFIESVLSTGPYTSNEVVFIQNDGSEIKLDGLYKILNAVSYHGK